MTAFELWRSHYFLQVRPGVWGPECSRLERVEVVSLCSSSGWGRHVGGAGQWKGAGLGRRHNGLRGFYKTR